MTKAKPLTASGHSAMEAPFSRGLEPTLEFEQTWAATRERREIGRTLEHMRREANLTQAELAEQMSKNQSFISRMESGRGPMPKARHIALWAHKCGYMTAYAFLAREGGGDGLRLHELRPIAQGEEDAVELESVRDVALSDAALAKTAEEA
ncbi:MAG: helix-turn-helix domain-containing protein [Kiloniellaceae bacterium]